ncbi:TMEM175 family protein [Streptomyces angustmyceticus]|uniref:TMEM175 family protein n=1 Tax=Streptomyces angustmyceticus TaxID=285578 RepID=UPI0021B080F1|nr:TMEM175 family protein [Streptomyces angustmyceticus]
MSVLAVTGGIEGDLHEFDARFAASGWCRGRTCPMGSGCYVLELEAVYPTALVQTEVLVRPGRGSGRIRQTPARWVGQKKGVTHMSACDAVDEIGAGGPTPAESVAVPDRAEGGASGERLILFTDAVTAISITLLVLPLVDLAPEVASAHGQASEVITGHLDQIWSFLLSFAVIANVWREHHRAFSSVVKVTRSLTVWNMGWLLSVVVLPLPTEMIAAFGRNRFVAGFYYATLLAGMVCRVVMLRILKTIPGLLDEDDQEPGKLQESYTESYLNALSLVLALVLALAVPVLQYYSLLLLLLPRWALLRCRRAR